MSATSNRGVQGFGVPPERLLRWRRAADGSAAVFVAIATVALAGWILRNPGLAIEAGGALVKANAAVALLAGALALVLVRDSSGVHRRHLATALIVGVGLVGLLCLLQYIFGWRLGIDETLFPQPAGSGPGVPGRVAPNTALALLLLGTGGVLNGQRRWPMLAQALAAGAVVVALGAMIGYARGVHSLTAFNAPIQMSLPTSVVLTLLSLATLASDVGRREEALAAIEEAVTVRRQLPVSNPAAHEPYLATSLNKLPVRLGEVDRHGDANRARREAADLLASRSLVAEPALTSATSGGKLT